MSHPAKAWHQLFIDGFHMGLSPLCALLFFSLFPNSGQCIWHTAVGLVGTLGTPGRGGASFREETQAGASNHLSAESPGTRSDLCLRSLPFWVFIRLPGRGRKSRFLNLFQHEDLFENLKLICASSCNSSCAFSMALRPLAIFLPLPRDKVCSP